MWNGMLSPYVIKHRDNKHNSVLAHLRAAGVTMDWDDDENGDETKEIYCDVDPITGNFLSPSKRHYPFTMTLGDKEYTFLIPEGKNGKPNEKELEAAIQDYVTHPVDGGRDLEDYIEDSVEDSLDND